MAAVVRPVGIDHADFGDGRVALLGVAEVGLQELEVVKVHRKTMWCSRSESALSSMWVKPTTDATLVGIAYSTLRVAGLSIEASRGVHGVDQVAANLVHVLSGEFAFQNVDLAAATVGRRRR